jgi:DnaJ-class molecular chaperone
MKCHIDLDKVTMLDFDKIIRCETCNGYKIIPSLSKYTSTGQTVIEKCYNCNGIGWVWDIKK